MAWIAAIHIGGVAWANDPTTTAPKIEIVGGAAHDWGSVAPGTVRTTVLVTNTGRDTLFIKEIHQSCGCTTAPIDKTVIPHGDTARINVSIDMHDKSGGQFKEVFVISNDPIDSMVTIELKANVVRDLTSSPTVFPTVLKVPIDLEFESEVTLSNDGTDTLKIGKPYFQGIGLKGRFVLGKDVLFPGEKTNLQAFITPTTYGYHANKVVVPSNSRFNPEILISLRTISDEPGNSPAQVVNNVGQDTKK